MLFCFTSPQSWDLRQIILSLCITLFSLIQIFWFPLLKLIFTPLFVCAALTKEAILINTQLPTVMIVELTNTWNEFISSWEHIYPFLSLQDTGRANCGLGRLENGDQLLTSLKWLLAPKLLFGAVMRERGRFAPAALGNGITCLVQEWDSFQIAQTALFE